ncbi:MAG TPA: ATP-binding cassette domain-containing protein [Verrucomicrobiales bacterium]|nr:ATP-binding cassette domain-containing protein [Verrucomicrobiales bacterium]HIL72355.1 ATP-binding cassette domain-containing protein [Verrucomicrobiota bacterium]
MIKVENLRRTFGPKVAVDGISFEVERGEVLGFLGPNGAGKSTTMRMITGFLTPCSGKISIGGFDVQENPIASKKLVGYLPENAPSYTDMTVQGFLGFTAELRGYRGSEKLKRVNRVLEMCFLEPVRHQSIETLSKGYKHRTCFAQSIIHDPDVLILDEPTDGLDPNQKFEVRNLIRRMGEKKAIIFSTHILEEVEAVCSKAMIIDRGRVIANGTPEELKMRSQRAGAVSLKVEKVSGESLKSELAKLSTAERVVIEDETETRTSALVVPKQKTMNGDFAKSIYNIATQAGWKIEQINTEAGKLDEVFREITMPDTVEMTEPKA